jgi:hypothetical protein
VGDIVATVERRYALEQGRALSDVEALLQALRREGLTSDA